MPTPLADKTNSPADKPGTPAYYKLSPGPEDLPIPPPPPLFSPNAEAAAELGTEDAASSSSVSPLKDKVLVGYAIGHVGFAVLYFSGVNLLSCGAWTLLTALLINGVKLSISAPAAPMPALSPQATQQLVDGINAAIGIFNNLKRGESPKLAFYTAVACWALATASAYLSVLPLLWLTFTLSLRPADLSPASASKVTAVNAALQAKLGTFTSIEDALAHVRLMLGPRAADIDALVLRLHEAVQAHIEQIKFVVPVGILLGWIFVLGWSSKFLFGGLGLLAYKAWASPEAAAQLDAKIGKTARSARRMTISACDRLSMLKPKVA